MCSICYIYLEAYWGEGLGERICVWMTKERHRECASQAKSRSELLIHNGLIS